MELLTSLKLEQPFNQAAAVTIGTFDGIHLGHQAVLRRLLEVAREKNLTPTVVTFDNHPRSVIRPDAAIAAILSLPHKLHLIEQYGIENAFLLAFTSEFSQQSAEEFLTQLQKATHLKTLILGHDARFGKDRSGAPEEIRRIADKLGFNVEYLNAIKSREGEVSSSHIRHLINIGDLRGASSLLGRPYSIFQSVESGHGRGRELGFPTLNLSVEGLCLPPLGVYTVSLLLKGEKLCGVANLGKAPSVKKLVKPILEVHLLNHQLDLYGEKVEVIFEQFLRPELSFSSHQELIAQIAKDVDNSKRFFEKQEATRQ